MIRGIVILGLAAFAGTSQASIIIDTFEQGYHKATITGEGNRDHLATGLDRNKVFAGHRLTDYIVDGNPYGYTTTFEVGLGEARVTTPGPRDLGTELLIQYGDFEPMNLNLAVFPGPGRLFEIDLGSDPPDLFAHIWQLRVRDGQGRTQINSRPGLRQGGIEFRRDGFVGVPDIDWSDIDYLSFRQEWYISDTAPLVYWATEMRAVPEPASLVVAGSLIVAVSFRRNRRCGR